MKQEQFSYTDSQRDVLFDLAKGLGMLLVVFAHVNYSEPIHTIIYSFHMPLFFVISGMLFNSSKYTSFRNFFVKRIKGLLIPYFVFAFSLLFLSILLMIVLKQSFSIWELLNSIKSVFLDRTYEDLRGVNNVALWFLPCLFVLECLYFWVNRVKHPLILFGIIVGIVSLGWILGRFSWARIPWNLRSAMFSIGFYAVGNRVFRPLIKKIKVTLGNVHKSYIYIYIYNMHNHFLDWINSYRISKWESRYGVINFFQWNNVL